MNYRVLGKVFYHSALVVLNGCVISACNYLAVFKTQHALDTNFWAKILLVRYNDHPAGHAYCVWETDGTIYGYDRNAGSFPIPVYTRDARASFRRSRRVRRIAARRGLQILDRQTSRFYGLSPQVFFWNDTRPDPCSNASKCSGFC